MSAVVDNTKAPASAVVYIEATWGNQIVRGTGFLVGRNDIITSANLVYDAKGRGQADDIRIIPLFDPKKGGLTAYKPSTIDYFDAASPGRYDFDGDGLISPGDGRAGTLTGAEADLALLSLRTPLGDSYGWFGLDGGFSSGGAVSIIGYPDKFNNAATLDTGTVRADPTDAVYYNTGDLEVLAGHSGSPIFYTTASGPQAVAVVSTGTLFADIGGHIDWLRTEISANDRLLAGYKGTSLKGTAGNNVFGLTEGKGFRTSVGNDQIDGGDGLDMVQYLLPRSSYTLSRPTQNVHELAVGQHYPNTKYDTLYNIERLAFADGIVAFDVNGSTGKAYRLYQAAFDRTPDAAGLKHNILLMDKGMTLKQMASAFLNSAEFKAKYGSAPSDTSYITSLYRNILGRDPEASGLAGWQNQLSGGHMDKADVLIGFSESAENKNVVDWKIWDGVWLG